MLADRVRMGSGGGKKDLIILYDNGNIYAEYGRTKNFSKYGEVGTITFNSDHFHIYTHSSTLILRAMVGFKLPPNLPTNAKIRVKYFNCSKFYVVLMLSIDILNSRETLFPDEIKYLSEYNSGTGEITITLGDTTGYEVVGVMTETQETTHNNSFEKLEVII